MLKELPKNYRRMPVVSWAINRVKQYNLRKGKKKLIRTFIDGAIGLEPVWHNDGDIGEMIGASDDDEGIDQNDVIIQPALPNTFKIFEIMPDDHLEERGYEISGVFTDYRLYELMNTEPVKTYEINHT